jgi:hypothetical protein
MKASEEGLIVLFGNLPRKARRDASRVYAKMAYRKMKGLPAKRRHSGVFIDAVIAKVTQPLPPVPPTDSTGSES